MTIGKSEYEDSNSDWTNENSIPVLVDLSPYETWTDWGASQRDLFFLDANGEYVTEFNISTWDSDKIYETILNIISTDEVYGCTDPEACNYNSEATVDDGCCDYGRTCDATEASIIIYPNEVIIQSDGVIGGVQMMLTHEDDFSIYLTDSALTADYVTESDTTRLLIVAPATNFLFSYNGFFVIEEIIVANSQCEVPVDILFYNENNLGDLNDDDLLNIQDVVVLVNIIMDSYGTEYTAAGDLNGDAYLNIMDVVQLINLIIEN